MEDSVTSLAPETHGAAGGELQPKGSTGISTSINPERVIFSSAGRPRDPDRQKSGKTLSHRTESVRSELAEKLSSTHLGSGQFREVFDQDTTNKNSPSGGSGSGDFPPAYNIIRAGKLMRLNAGKLGSMPGLERVSTKVGFPTAGLCIKDDGRALCAQNYHCAEKGVNISLSIGKPKSGGGGA